MRGIGCGAALVTDRKTNLNELFDVGSEVVDYDDPGECLAQIQGLIGDGDRCRGVGSKGQARTCQTIHTFSERLSWRPLLRGKHERFR